MAELLDYHVCPETGICTLLRAGGTAKLDLMPDEVAAVRDAAGDLAAVKAILADSDAAFTASLSAEELAEIGTTLR